MSQHSLRRRALGLLGALSVASLVLAGCGNGGTAEPETPTATEDAEPTEEGGEAGLEKVTIGISQLGQHPALDAATAGFKRALIEGGYVEGDTVVFDEQNAQFEIANTTTIAQKFANDGVDLVLAVATPAAQAAAQNITDIPVLFTAVTDAVEASLVASNDMPGGNISGTSDINPVADQIALIKEILPDAKRVGIVYSSGEVNSEIQVNIAKETAAELGIEIVESTVTKAADVQESTIALGDVDAIYVPTDNNVVSGIAALVQVAEDNGILVIGAESGTVEGGAVATLGINYELLGYQTGKMALKILQEGADISAMPVETQTEFELTVNPGAAERMGITLPEGFVEKADQIIE